MRKHVAISCLTALLGISQIANADEHRRSSSGDIALADRNAATFYYPKAWCIRTYLSNSARPIPVSRVAPPAPERLSRLTSTLDHAEAPIAASSYSDRSSLLERLRAFRSTPLATLWRGRDTALVLRVQDGGYFGISVADLRTDAD